MRTGDRLVAAGKSIVVIEHHQTVMAHADRILDTGHDGDRIVFAGTPAALIAARSILIDKHFASYVGA